MNRYWPETTCTTKVAQLFRERGLSRVDVITATNLGDRTLTRLTTLPYYHLTPRTKALLSDLLEVEPDELWEEPTEVRITTLH